MYLLNSKFLVADNSRVLTVKLITKKRFKLNIKQIIKTSLLTKQRMCKFKKKTKFNTLAIQVPYIKQRKSGNYFKFSQLKCILLDKTYNLIATRIKEPADIDLIRFKNFKINSLIPFYI